MRLPEAFAVFSDDIRHEAGGKTTIVGIYSALMRFAVPTMPSHLARLGITVYLRWSSLEDVAPVTIQVYFPGQPDEPALEDTFDPRANLNKLPEDPGRQPSMTMNAVLEMVPIQPDAAFKVYVSSAAGRQRAGYLLVQHDPPKEVAPSTELPATPKRRRRARSAA